MFASLRLDRLVRSYYQQDKIDSTNSSQHVAHKSLMARNINKSQPQLLAGRGDQFQMSEPQVNGDAPPLLFFQAVGVNPGQRLHQRGLAMVNVAGSANDD